MPNTREKLIELLAKYFDIGDSYAYNLTRDKQAFMCGTMGFDDFEEFDDETVADIADHLIANGVTVQEWIPVDEPPKEKGRYLCNVKWFSFPGKYYQTVLKWDDGFIEGRFYTDDVTHWMPLPEPPKGE